MQSERKKWSSQIRQRRSIYRFGGVWAQVLLASVPWINVIILIGLLLVVHKTLMIAPGVLFNLPQAPLREGSYPRLMALMLQVSHDMLGSGETLVFFDDDRYSLLEDEQMEALAERLRQRLSFAETDELLLLADKNVPHGDVLSFVNIARKAGVAQVNVAVKPEK